MRKLFLKIVAAMLIASALLFVGCGGGVSDEILISALEMAAPRANELYGVIYGDALEHLEAGDDGYCQISMEAKLRSIADIRTALRTVFTPEYCAILENTAFNGVSSEEGMIAAKFVERSNVLFVNPEVTADFGEPRTFDLSKAKVIKKNPYMAIILLTHESGDIEVALKNVDGIWLIDSPMF